MLKSLKKTLWGGHSFDSRDGEDAGVPSTWDLLEVSGAPEKTVYIEALSEPWSSSGAGTGAGDWAQLEPGCGEMAFCTSPAYFQGGSGIPGLKAGYGSSALGWSTFPCYLGIPDTPQSPKLSTGEGRQSPNPRGSCTLQELSTRETTQGTGRGKSTF